MKIENISNKIIGFGKENVLPGETKDIGSAFDNNAAIDGYLNAGLIKVIGRGEAPKEVPAEEPVDDSAEQLRQARLASLKGISEEDLGQLANELGINPADAKDQKDLLKKVKAALEK